MPHVRLAVDIGGTFTDVALDAADGTLETAKVLTTHGAPEAGALEAIVEVLARRSLAARDVDLVIHGTTLATNAIIERKGARTALVATDGFRDTLAIGYEDRFDQYDLSIEKAQPLVPRELRFTVPERIAVDGTVLRPLDEAAVGRVAAELGRLGVEAVAVAFIHAYAAPAHEERVGALLADALPGVSISLSSAVSPEAREYERTMTTVVNAYVQPMMAGYLGRFEEGLARAGVDAPLLLMTSGGGLTPLRTARRFPVRLVESGPAGGAILAAEVARACGERSVIGFDMGGTTAKICLIDDGVPRTSRTFEFDRQARFTKGSGLPIRIPVIDMIEIGAGGGSIARVDALKRIAVGPHSAGSEPGPVAYGRGGRDPTVTDADLVLGRLDPTDFAGGRLTLDQRAAGEAIDRAVGTPLGLPVALAAFGVSEIVDETMANAARVHAVESGADVAARTLVAFGGAAPLHAGRLADKLGIDRIVVPAHAGVGSAVGFLYAPVAFQIVRSAPVRVDTLDRDAVEAVFDELDADARAAVAAAAPGAAISAERTAYLRYVGQGHEVAVVVPDPLTRDALLAAFEDAYRALFHRTIDGAPVEVMSWSLALSAPTAAMTLTASPPVGVADRPLRPLYDAGRDAFSCVPVVERAALRPGEGVDGPALVVEAATTTLVPHGFAARLRPDGHLVLDRIQPGAETAP